MFLTSNLVHGFRHLPHNMKPVKGNLLVTIGDMLPGGGDRGWPHVHADTFNRTQPVIRQTPVPIVKGAFPPPLANMDHLATDRIGHNRDIIMALFEGGLIHTHMGQGILVPPRQATHNRTLLDPVKRRLAHAQQTTDGRNAGLPQPINHQSLKPDREPGQTFRPRNRHRHHPMLGTHHPGNVTHKIRPVVHSVQMTPPALPMIIARTLAPTRRTNQTIGAIVGNRNTHFPFLVDNIQRHNLPRRLKGKQLVERLPGEVSSWFASSCHGALSLSLKLLRGIYPIWDCSSTPLLKQPAIP